MRRKNVQNKIRLGVNVDHIATLRQLRGGSTAYPDLLAMVKLAVDGGADQITIHLREDRRHIQDKDLDLLSKKCPVPLNLEMAATEEMVKIAKKARPKWVCLVPEKREELTTEGGLDVGGQLGRVKKITLALVKAGISVSHFIAPDVDQIISAHDCGAQAVEFHTGHWALLSYKNGISANKKAYREWKRLVRGAVFAHALGLRVHAGHGLDFQLANKVAQIPWLEEVNIGHSLVCYSVEMGLKKAVQKMKRCLKWEDIKINA